VKRSGTPGADKNRPRSKGAADESSQVPFPESTPALLKSLPHGVADSWGSASLHPRLLSGAPSALKRRSGKTQTLPPRLSCHKKVTILEVYFSAVAAILNSAWDLGERAGTTVTPGRSLMLERLLLMRPSENAKTPQRRFI
jgi:hypothetical protein